MPDFLQFLWQPEIFNQALGICHISCQCEKIIRQPVNIFYRFPDILSLLSPDGNGRPLAPAADSSGDVAQGSLPRSRRKHEGLLFRNRLCHFVNLPFEPGDILFRESRQRFRRILGRYMCRTVHQRALYPPQFIIMFRQPGAQKPDP